MSLRLITCLLLLAPALCGTLRAESIELRARDAVLAGGGPTRYFTNSAHDCIGHWTTTNVTATWSFALKERGTYRVVAVVAHEDGGSAARFTVEVGDQRANGVIPRTGGWFRFTELDLGPVILRRPGTVQVVVHVDFLKGGGAMNLRAIRLERQP